MAQSLADLLRELVTESDESIYAIAKATGISQPTLQEFVHGRAGGEPRNMSLDKAQPLMDYFGVRVTAPRRAKST